MRRTPFPNMVSNPGARSIQNQLVCQSLIVELADSDSDVAGSVMEVASVDEQYRAFRGHEAP